MISAVVLTLNEERHLPDCLESLRWADEIVVLDSGSTDQTQAIARRYTDRVFERPFDNYSRQRNAALELASGDWVLFVDADERVPAKLAAEVQQTVRDTPHAGLWLPRRNWILGKWIAHSGWYPDYQLRLLRRAAARYDANQAVHEVATVAGTTGRLQQPLEHINYERLGELLEKQRAYAAFEARTMHARGIRPKPQNYVLQPLREFRRRYVTWQGYQDGLHGLLLAALMAGFNGVAYSDLARLWREADGGGRSSGGAPPAAGTPGSLLVSPGPLPVIPDGARNPVARGETRSAGKRFPAAFGTTPFGTSFARLRRSVDSRAVLSLAAGQAKQALATGCVADAQPDSALSGIDRGRFRTALGMIVAGIEQAGVGTRHAATVVAGGRDDRATHASPRQGLARLSFAPAQFRQRVTSTAFCMPGWTERVAAAAADSSERPTPGPRPVLREAARTGPPCSVVIVSYNVADLLERCVASVLTSQAVREVVIVDNASVDGSADRLEAAFPSLRVIRSDRNVGFARGINRAIAATSGRYVMVLNPDCQVRPGSVERLCAVLDEQPTVAVAGPRTFYGDGRPQSSRRRFPELLDLFVESTVLDQYGIGGGRVARVHVADVPETQPQDVDWLVGACLIVRREAMRTVGLLDEGYFMYFEELDWCRRFRRAGWRVRYEPAAEVVHLYGKSAEQDPALRDIRFSRSKLRYARKWHGRFAASALRGFLFVHFSVRVAVDLAKLAALSKPGLRVQRLHQLGRVLASGLRIG